ncbi:MAG: spermidine synthase, partial [Lentisphaerae bacterium]|nr:spermidine synthase [Lentisphaerota bacterium]
FAVCLPTVYAIRGRKFTVNDGHFLFLGLGFLLLETKSIGDCSLYFGTTWFVTMLVVAGVLLMVLGANIVAMCLKQFNVWMYAPLFASLLLLYVVDRNFILGLDFNWRFLWTLLVVPLPIFFAGLIFSTTFRDAVSPAAFFGANLIGAMIGGFCEYIGMVTGTKSLMLLVICAYFLSLLCRIRLARKN